MFNLVGASATLGLVANAWQIPGLVPKNYEKNTLIDIFVDQLHTPRSSFTFDYYMLNWCTNNQGKGYEQEKFGQTLTGSETHESPYRHRFGYDQSVLLCEKTLTHSEVEQFSFFIQNDFRYTLYLDDLPSAVILRDANNRELEPNYQEGIPIGVFEGLGRIKLYNHLEITVITHDTIEGHHRIVGFDVEPFSIGNGDHRLANDPKQSEPLYIKGDETFYFSYKIIQRNDPKTTWAMRMDHYVKTGNNNIHLANILYAILLVGALVITLTFLLNKTIRADFKNIDLINLKRKEKRDERRRRDNTEDEIGLTSNKRKSDIKVEDVTWKRLQGDVFRKPDFAVLLCTMFGMGVHTLMIAYIMIISLATGLVAPAGRWFSLYNAFMYFLIAGACNGFCTGRLMKYFGATEWRFSASIAAFCLPTMVIFVFLLVDIIEYFEKSSQVFPFTSMVFFCFLWILFNVPATYYCAYQAFRLQPDVPPCKVSPVRRLIPAQSFYLSDVPSVLLSGFLMFSCFMIEFHYVLTSVWRSYLIGMFGFLFINMNLLICVVSLVSILNTYLCLQAQNWQWWWRAFFSGYSTTLFVLAYCVYHMIFEFGMDIFWSDVVFLLYSILVSNLFGLMCGTISLTASLFFVTLLYQQGKSD